MKTIYSDVINIKNNRENNQWRVLAFNVVFTNKMEIKVTEWKKRKISSFWKEICPLDLKLLGMSELSKGKSFSKCWLSKIYKTIKIRVFILSFWPTLFSHMHYFFVDFLMYLLWFCLWSAQTKLSSTFSLFPLFPGAFLSHISSSSNIGTLIFHLLGPIHPRRRLLPPAGGSRGPLAAARVLMKSLPPNRQLCAPTVGCPAVFGSWRRGKEENKSRPEQNWAWWMKTSSHPCFWHVLIHDTEESFSCATAPKEQGVLFIPLLRNSWRMSPDFLL